MEQPTAVENFIEQYTSLNTPNIHILGFILT